METGSFHAYVCLRYFFLRFDKMKILINDLYDDDYNENWFSIVRNLICITGKMVDTTNSVFCDVSTKLIKNFDISFVKRRYLKSDLSISYNHILFSHQYT